MYQKMEHTVCAKFLFLYWVLWLPRQLKTKGLWALSTWRTAGFVYKRVSKISVYVCWISRANNRANVLQLVCCVCVDFCCLVNLLISDKKCTMMLWCTGRFIWPFGNCINPLVLRLVTLSLLTSVWKRKEAMLLVARIDQEMLFGGYEKLTRLEIG